MMIHSRLEHQGKSSPNFSNLLLFSALIGLFAIDMALYHPSLWGFIAIAVVWGIASQKKLSLSRTSKRWLLGALALVGLPLLLLNSWADPSHAILLTDAQTFFTDQLTTEGTASQATAVNMIFNVARGLYIFYLIVAVVGAWNTAQRDEDWVPVIKVPVMSLLAIFGLDVMTNLIIT
jgi:hypothetical protein